MKVAKSLLLGSAAVLATVVGAQAADLPTRKAAPVQYVKICDAYGAGFFYIPGTDTCLRVGGLVLADWQVSSPSTRFNAAGVTSVAAVNGGAFGFGTGGALPSAYVNSGARDMVSSLALGRIELDARTQSPWGTVRTFLRLESQFGSGQVSATGAFPGAALGVVASAGYGSYASAKEITYLNKAFIQFAGITMGRIQSMFDFYADAVGYTALRGSNATVNGLAYTMTFGGGFSATLSVEDSISRRQGPGSVQVYSNPFVIGVAALPGVVGGLPTAAGAPAAIQNGTRLPEVVANLRLDQPWGSAQIMGAIHQTRTGLYTLGGAAPGGAPAGLLFLAGPQPFSGVGNFNNSSQIGWAIGGGLKFNLDMLSPGDVLWLQAIYAKGAIGYTSGNNLGFVNGFNYSQGMGVGLARVSSGIGYNGTGVGDFDCVFDMTGRCSQSSSFSVTAGLRHYWTPTISSTLTGSFWSVQYSGNVTNPAPASALVNAGTVPFVTGITNYRETTLATGLEWNPIRNFGLGAEIAWQRGMTSRPVGLASDAVLNAAGLPSFKGTADLIRGRVRMYRAF